MPGFFLEAIVMTASGIIITLHNCLFTKYSYKNFSSYGVLGIFGNHICYIFAIRLVKAPVVDFIYSLSPFILMLISKNNSKMKYQNLAIALAGIGLILILINKGSFAFSQSLFFGGFIAFSGIFLWSIFMLKTSYSPESSRHLIGLYLVISGLISALLSIGLESGYVMKANDMYGLIWLTIGPCALAYSLWDAAIKNGPIIKVGWIGLLIPVFSYTLLLLFGVMQLEFTTLAAIGLIFISNLIMQAEQG